MKSRSVVLLLVLIMTAPLAAQKRGSREMGGGLAFWTKTMGDSSVSNLELLGLYGIWMKRDLIIEILPSVTLNFREKDTDASGLLLAQASYKLVDLSNLDREESTQYLRKYERSTGAVFASFGGGLWLENGAAKPTIVTLIPPEKRAYSGGALTAGIVTRSMLGSLTNVRSAFQYVYLLPTEPLYDKGRSMFTISVMFSVVSAL